MPCACEVNRRLTYMQKKYGSNMPKSKATQIGMRVRLFFEDFWLYLLLIPIVPVVILPAVIAAIRKRKIRLGSLPVVGKFFRRKNVEE